LPATPCSIHTIRSFLVKKAVLLTAVVLLFGGWLTDLQSAEGSDVPTLLKFRTMVGVTPPFTGTTNPIQGVPGAGAAWKDPRVQGELKADGELEIKVRGLVLVSTGANPSPTFRGIVSCRSIDRSATPATPSTVIVTTGLFPATPTGDSEIEQKILLPNPCIAPIVFVGPGADPVRWFSVTGVARP
jgi:hypothetical protein